MRTYKKKRFLIASIFYFSISSLALASSGKSSMPDFGEESSGKKPSSLKKKEKKAEEKDSNSSSSASSEEEAQESEDEKLLKKNRIRVGAGDSDRIFISGLMYYHYDEIKDSLFREIDAWSIKKSSGFTFSGCRFNSATLNSLKNELDKYKKSYSVSLFDNCYYETENGTAKLNKSEFFSKKIEFNNIKL